MIHIRQMTDDDLALGLHLCRQAGWNQTLADWQRFLKFQPDGCFVAQWQEIPVGTTVTTLFGPVSWISMVLVDEWARGRGIGTALLRHALEFLDQRGVLTIRLDATPLGRPLDERLGFVEQFELARYEGTLPPTPDASGVETAFPEQWDALAALDEAATGTHRRGLLWRLFAEQPDEVRFVQRGDHTAGFLVARPGHRAIQIGPCVASPEVGPLLFADAWHRYVGKAVFLDIPLSNQVATWLAESRGLTVQRHLTRMCRGVQRCECVEWLWASSGPEKG
jgi:GNAT superfamily N-acetyltransferase